MTAANTRPPPPVTGIANAKCYARALSDCDDEITREHYISKKLLDGLEDFESDGFRWLSGKKSLPTDALRSHILCKRHNNALSPIDDKITDLYDMMRRWQDRKPVGDVVLDGEDLERWAIKVMFGLFASGGMTPDTSPARPRSTPAIPKRHMQILFSEREMPRGAGFYYAHTEFPNQRPVSLRCRAHWTPNKPSPDTFVMSIVGFTWVTTLKQVAPEPHLYRPSDFDIGDTGTLTLLWNGTRRKIKSDPRISLHEIVEGKARRK